MNPPNLLSAFHLAASASLLAASSIHAADGTWIVSAGAATHNWTDSDIWTSGAIADGTGFTANFTGIGITGNKVVSLNGVNRTIGNITFTDATTVSHGLTLSGNTLNLDVTTGKPNITVTNTGTAPAGQLTISSQISGGDGLEKNGLGILVLSGNNNYTGTTVINSGTLTLGSANALGASSSPVSVVSGAALNMNGFNMGPNTNALTLNGPGIGGTGALLNSSTSANGIYTGSISLAGATTIGNTGTFRMQINSYLATNGHTLSFKGTSAGMIIFSPPASGITGSGSVVVDGAYLRLVDGGGNISTSNYTGTTTVINGGTILYFNNNIGSGNISLNGGTLAGYASAGFNRPFGAGSGQIQIAGGESGFGMNGSGTINFSNVTEVQWGSASFNPSKLIVGGGSVAFGGTVTFAEGIDLNGANRTIRTTDTGVLSGVIRTTTGTAGLIKEGSGTLSLTAANTYNGGTTISAGNLRFNSLTAMPSSGNVTVNTGATLTVEAGAAGDWTSGSSGAGALGGLVAGVGSAGTSTVSFATDSTLGLEMTGNLTYAGDIPSLGTNVGITKTGGSSLTLTGNNNYTGRTRVHAGILSFNSIANVGAGSSALGAPTTAASGTPHRLRRQRGHPLLHGQRPWLQPRDQPVGFHRRRDHRRLRNRSLDTHLGTHRRRRRQSPHSHGFQHRRELPGDHLPGEPRGCFDHHEKRCGHLADQRSFFTEERLDRQRGHIACRRKHHHWRPEFHRLRRHTHRCGAHHAPVHEKPDGRGGRKPFARKLRCRHHGGHRNPQHLRHGGRLGQTQL
jgi:fibronectin-binding autotransporter adhesin